MKNVLQFSNTKRLERAEKFQPQHIQNNFIIIITLEMLCAC